MLHNRSLVKSLQRGLIGMLVIAGGALAATSTVSAQTLPAAAGQTGYSGTVVGQTETLQQIQSRAVQTRFAVPREGTPRRVLPHTLPTNLPASSVSANSAPTIDGKNLPQVLSAEILGPAITDTPGYVPPDTMGAVGSKDFLFSVNTHLRAFLKTAPYTQVWDIDEVAFWGSTADASGVSDTHVRYDPNTRRWFITEIDVPNGNNHILLAVSSSDDLATASWTKFAIPEGNSTHDNGCFADYDTPGLDQNGIYIGANMFQGIGSCSGQNYLHANLYVIQKSSALTSTVHYTQFFAVATGIASIETIQGVDSIDASAVGHAIAVNDASFPTTSLKLWTINNPGTTSPTLSSPVNVTIPAYNGSLGGVVSLNNANSGSPTRGMDDIDDRLFSATIRNGHLWTAHNAAVSSSGSSSSGTLNRDAVRWYDINMAGPSLNQSGTVFDGAGSGFLNYWMGTVMVSGQGHVALGLNRANSTTAIQAGAVGRLASDAAGTMRGFSMFQNSTNDAYDDSGFVPNPTNRWGDYTYTSLDPCDDMTMWTTQEFVAGSADGGVDWQVAAEKLLAPPPAVLSGSAGTITTGQTAGYINLVGTSPNGEGFYDTPSTITDTCRTRLTASATNGVTVTGVTYVNPLHVTLKLNTVGASTGTSTITITNPDGQTTNTTISMVTPPAGRIDTIGIFRSGTFYLKLHNTTGNADITVTFNPGSNPYPIVGDWTGSGVDTVGVYNRSTGQFNLCTSNVTANCANAGNQIVLALGVANDLPLSGRWSYSATNAGVGVFRPSNGLIYLKNALTSGYADYTMVLGIPSDVGLAGDWSDKGFDSPGVYRPSTSFFYLSNQVTSASVIGDAQLQYGIGGDAPVAGDWVAQGHDGIGLFRQTNGFTYLKNALTTGYADNSFVYGIAGDVPVAGHWQSVYPPVAKPSILVPKTATPGTGSTGNDNPIGD